MSDGWLGVPAQRRSGAAAQRPAVVVMPASAPSGGDRPCAVPGAGVPVQRQRPAVVLTQPSSWRAALVQENSAGLDRA